MAVDKIILKKYSNVTYKKTVISLIVINLCFINKILHGQKEYGIGKNQQFF